METAHFSIMKMIEYSTDWFIYIFLGYSNILTHDTQRELEERFYQRTRIGRKKTTRFMSISRSDVAIVLPRAVSVSSQIEKKAHTSMKW